MHEASADYLHIAISMHEAYCNSFSRYKRSDILKKGLSDL